MRAAIAAPAMKIAWLGPQAPQTPQAPQAPQASFSGPSIIGVSMVPTSLHGFYCMIWDILDVHWPMLMVTIHCPRQENNDLQYSSPLYSWTVLPHVKRIPRP